MKNASPWLELIPKEKATWGSIPNLRFARELMVHASSPAINWSSLTFSHKLFKPRNIFVFSIRGKSNVKS